MSNENSFADLFEEIDGNDFVTEGAEDLSSSNDEYEEEAAEEDTGLDSENDEAEGGEGDEEGDEGFNLETDEGNEEIEKGEEIDVLSSYDSLADALIEDGLVDFDDEKEYDFSTKEGFAELINDTRHKSEEEGVAKYKEGLGEDVKKYLEIAENGGNLASYQEEANQVVFKDVDLYDEDDEPMINNMENLIEDLMLKEEATQEEINDRIGI